MSIRILNHNATAHQLSASLTTAFQFELRRIGESISPPTVNLWVSNQTLEELLDILKRIPDRPTDGNGSGGDGVRVPLSSKNPQL